jgi:D-beta-D-heptose 7-phosphate kinase/D-beta-D-heptose 1-phosphate adenosyltransferase
MSSVSDKIRPAAELAPLIERRRAKGSVVVFTNGCFDIIHRGHVQYLVEAKRLGDILVVGLNSDASVKRIKGPRRPLFSEGDRAFVLAALDAVDFVVVFDQDTPLELILALKPDVIVKGGDWQEEDIVGGREVKGWGGSVRRIDYIEGYSTSNIIESMKRL